MKHMMKHPDMVKFQTRMYTHIVLLEVVGDVLVSQGDRENKHIVRNAEIVSRI